MSQDHRWRRNKRAFDDTQEMDSSLDVPDVDEIMRQLKGFQKRARIEIEGVDGKVVWKKRCIFFTLPYSKDNLLRHNLDVMQIEKIAIDNIIGTLLDIKGKKKEGYGARKTYKKWV